MNAWLITASVVAQVAILAAQALWWEAIGVGAVACAVVSMFAFTRRHWDAHLDMFLLMAGPGGLGMLAPLLSNGPACHAHLTWTGYALMTAGMWLLSVPPSWQYARCIQAARSEGIGPLALTLDIAGMQVGMTLVHLLLGYLPMLGPRMAWLHHALMLLGMLLGMGAAMLAVTRIRVHRLARA